MKKPPKKPIRSAFKDTDSSSAVSERVLSSAEVRRKNSLTRIEKRDLEARRVRKANTATPKPKTSTSARKSSRNQSATKTDRLNEIERLVSQEEKTGTDIGVSTRVKLYIALFVFALLGTLACLWTMLNTTRAETLANNLELRRVANSLDNILSVLALPALMFTVILMVYSVQRLYQLYRRANYLEGSAKRTRRRQ